MNAKLKKKLKKIKLLAMDFDGVHTDGRVYVDQNGKETVVCSRLDGMGLELLRRLTDVKACVISKEVNPVVTARCNKLKLHCHQGVDKADHKRKILDRVIQEHGITREEVIFMGDDVQDLGALEHAGLAVAVANARPEVKVVADYVTIASGGNGAIREVCDLILEARGIQKKI